MVRFHSLPCVRVAVSTTLQVRGGACCTNIDLIGIVHAFWLRNQSIATRWWLSILIRTPYYGSFRRGCTSTCTTAVLYPRANPCAMPGLGYTQGRPDRATSITEFHNRHSQNFKVPMASSVSVSHPSQSFRGVL